MTKIKFSASNREIFILLVVSLFVSPMFPRIRLDFVPVQARVGSAPLGIHHIIYLLIIIIFFLSIVPQFETTRPQLFLISVWITLLSVIIFTGYPQPDLRTVLGHLAVIAVTVVLSIFIQTGKEIRLIDIIHSAYISGFVISVWDITVLLTPIKFGATTGSLLPLISRGGIGLPVSSGTHGIVVGMGIVAGLHSLQQYRNEPVLEKELLITTILLMIFSILLSGSRSSLMALLIGVSVYYSYKLRVLGRRAFVVLSAIVAMLLAVIGYKLASLRFRTVYQRLNQNQASIELTLDHPLTGVGWQEVFPMYLDKVIHNTPLNYFAASGLAGGFIFLLAVLYPASMAFRSLLNHSSDQKKIIVVLISMWAIIVTELMFYKSTPNIYLFVIGISMCLNNRN